MATIPSVDLAIPDTRPRPRGPAGAFWLFVRKNPLGAAGGLHGAPAPDRRALRRRASPPTTRCARRAACWWRRARSSGWAPTTSAAISTAGCVHGARISLVVGLASTLLGAVVGGLVGLVSGYVGGTTDLVAQRVMDIMQALPILVLALVLAAALGPSLTNTVIAISVVIAPRAARVVRASVLVHPRVRLHRVGARAGREPRPGGLAPHPAQHLRALHRAGHRAARRRHPGRGGAVVPRPRRARALSLLGPHAVHRRRGVRAEGAVAGDLSRGSPSASRCSAPTCSATRSATRSTRGCAAPDRRAHPVDFRNVTAGSAPRIWTR